MHVPRTLKILGLLLVDSLLGGTAFERRQSVITSSDIKDETIQNRDIDKGVITMNRFAQSTQDKINEAATPGPGGGAGSASSMPGRRVRLVPPAPPERRVLPDPQGPSGTDRALPRPPSSASPPSSCHRPPQRRADALFESCRSHSARRAGQPPAVSSGSRAPANQAPCKVSLGAAVISPDDLGHPWASSRGSPSIR